MGRAAMSEQKTAILTDIEGTTTDVAFVHSVLFPYAAKALPDFLRAHYRKKAVAAEIRAVRERIGAKASLDEVIATLLQWIREDRKETPLKALQGLIWETGYKEGAFLSPIYPDAAEMMRKWKAEGRDLYVYSSGSVAAQRLLFGYSEAGDLNPLFSGYFDTNIGKKQETASYAAIARELGREPRTILFLSDHPGEVSAALQAGMKSIRIDRTRAPDAAPELVDGQMVYGGFGPIEPDRV
jgi:enolase-phosphatase E1